MAFNRFAYMFEQSPSSQNIPQQPRVPAGFVVCPIHSVAPQGAAPATPADPVAELYRRAREEAEARARITRLHKRLFSVWN